MSRCLLWNISNLMRREATGYQCRDNTIGVTYNAISLSSPFESLPLHSTVSSWRWPDLQYRTNSLISFEDHIPAACPSLAMFILPRFSDMPLHSRLLSKLSPFIFACSKTTSFISLVFARVSTFTSLLSKRALFSLTIRASKLREHNQFFVCKFLKLRRELVRCCGLELFCVSETTANVSVVLFCLLHDEHFTVLRPPNARNATIVVNCQTKRSLVSSSQTQTFFLCDTRRFAWIPRCLWKIGLSSSDGICRSRRQRCRPRHCHLCCLHVYDVLRSSRTSSSSVVVGF